jgi:hypothetical protein
MWLGVPWVLWGLLALLVAGAYSVVWPRSRADGSRQAHPLWRHFVLRGSHPLVWVLLALSCFVRADLPPRGSQTATLAALLALAAYAGFLVALALVGVSGRHGSRRN